MKIKETYQVEEQQLFAEWNVLIAIKENGSFRQKTGSRKAGRGAQCGTVW